MKNLTRFGLAAGLAGALALLGSAQAQNTKEGPAGSGTGSGAPEGVGQGDTGRMGQSPSSGPAAGDTGSKAMTPSSDRATGGAGASASASDTATGAPSAARKLDKGLEEKLEKIHAANQAEIQVAQLGATNAQSPDVKEFAQKMQSSHETMDQQLTQQAQTMGVSLEGKTFQKEQQSATKDMEKLQSKTGQDFDKAFMSRIVKDHPKASKEVKGAASDAKKQKQPELASMLQEVETQMQGHLTHAKQLEKSVGQQRQGRRPMGSSAGSSMGGSPGTGTPSEPAPGSTGSQGTSGSQTGQTPSDTGSSSSHSTH